jgi:predicted nucleotide-binding protein
MSLREWLKESAGIQKVVVMKDEFGAGRTLPEKFEKLADAADKAIAVATPDDLGGLADSNPKAFQRRARQNVWLEFGWFWGRLGRENAMMLSRGQIELPSDLTGLEYYAYHSDPVEQAEKIRCFLGLQYRNASTVG